MIWHLIESGFNSGEFNMEFDMQLTKSCGNNDAFFRLFRWNPYCISLGANQSYSDISIKSTSEENIDIVKRPTGGRAVLHAEEITYSVVIPYSQGISVKHIYKKVSEALVLGLELYNPLLSESELENVQPDFKKLLQSQSGVICFGSTAKNEVKYKGKKIIGSAQRKMNNAILQHGSILCGTYHRRLVEFLNTNENNKQFLTHEIFEKTIEIETILDEPVDYEKLTNCLIEGFEKSWQIKFDRKVSAAEYI